MARPLDRDDLLAAVPEALRPVFGDAHRRLARDADPRATAGEAVPDAVVRAIDEAQAPVVLAGPGVLDGSGVAGLRALAKRASLGVLNTWGAKGVFDWRSPHHLATAGLQAWDFERGGLGAADLIVATGIDEAEARGGWRLAPVVDVPAAGLAALAERVAPREREIEVPPLRVDLASITQAGWTRTDAPLPPTRVTQHYSALLGDGGLVAADPGVAGYWVARTYATQHLGGALVPADAAARGFAVAAATVARLVDPSRLVLAVVDAMDDATELARDTAARLGVPVSLEVWAAEGPSLDADAHAARLRDLVDSGGQVEIATDPSQLEEMLGVAGPIVAWTT